MIHCLNVTPNNLNSSSVFITIQIKRKIVYFYKASFIFILLSVLSYAASDYPLHFQTFLRNSQHFNQNFIQIKRGYNLWCWTPLSMISWQSVLLVDETGLSGENHRIVASHWQTLSHNAVSGTPLPEWDSNSQL